MLVLLLTASVAAQRVASNPSRPVPVHGDDNHGLANPAAAMVGWSTSSVAPGNPHVGSVGCESTVYFAAGHSVVALRASDGTIRWEQRGNQSTVVANSVALADTDGISMAVSPNGSMLYVGQAPTLRAVRTDNGTTSWTVLVGLLTTDPLVSADSTTLYIRVCDMASLHCNISALDASSGAVKWATALTSDALHVDHVPTVSISHDGNSLYAGDHSTSLLCLHADNGTVRWSYNFGNSGFSGVVHWAPLPSPDGVSVYVATWFGQVIAFNANNGTKKWTIGSAQFCTSIALSPDGSTVYYQLAYTGITALAASNGTKKWNAPDPCGRPVVSPDGLTVYSTSVDGNVYAYDSSTGSTLWHTPELVSVSGDYIVSPDSTTLYAAGFSSNVVSAVHTAVDLPQPGCCTQACSRCKDGWIGDNCAECDSEHFGPICSHHCTCINGNCSFGLLGNGTCVSCDSNWTDANCDDCDTDHFGVNCSALCTCTSPHAATNSSGTLGNGTCVACVANWSLGADCNDCDSGHFGANCSEPCTCKHGIVSSGIHGNGSSRAD